MELTPATDNWVDTTRSLGCKNHSVEGNYTETISMVQTLEKSILKLGLVLSFGILGKLTGVELQMKPAPEEESLKMVQTLFIVKVMVEEEDKVQRQDK